MREETLVHPSSGSSGSGSASDSGSTPDTCFCADTVICSNSSPDSDLDLVVFLVLFRVSV